MKRHRKPRPPGDVLRAEGLALPLCWLPEPQPRTTPGPMPGRPDNGRLWFEGDPRPAPGEGDADEEPVWSDDLQEACLQYMVRHGGTLEPETWPRDVRRGDRWLPWHRRLDP